MNCFEWQSRASDFLDGILMGPEKKEAEKHLEECEACNERHQHYRIILTSIAGAPRVSLPIPVRKAPLSALFTVKGLSKGRLLWKQTPWYIRTTLEGTGIVFLILLTISAGPKLRQVYERQIEKSVTEYDETFKDPALATGTNPEPPLQAQGDPADSGEDDFANTADQEENESADSGDEVASDDLHAGSSEVWRFNLKSSSPQEVRPKIVNILTELQIPKNTPGLSGIEAPGGIQFDIFVPQAAVPSLKHQLEKIAPPAPEGLVNSPMGETFAWYKNKSKRKLPNGKTRVVIWLSQM